MSQNIAAYTDLRKRTEAFKSSPDFATLDFVVGAYVRYKDAEDLLASARAAHEEGVLFADRGVEQANLNLKNARRDMAEALFRMTNTSPEHGMFFFGISVLIEPLNERLKLTMDDMQQAAQTAQAPVALTSPLYALGTPPA